MPDKTYSKIGAFVSDFEFNSPAFRIPPRVAASMDDVQKWAVVSAQQAIEDAGYDKKEFDRNRTAVIIGNAMAGEMQHFTNMRIYQPRYARTLKETPSFKVLPEGRFL